MVFVKSHIPSRKPNDFKIPSNIQIIPFEKMKNGKLHQFKIYPEKQTFSLKKFSFLVILT